MKSLSDLNNKAENDLQEFTDERTGKVIWDRTQYDTVFDIVQDENDYIGLNIPLKLIEIVNYQQTQLKLEIDLSQTSGEVQFEKLFPSWATVTESSRVYTISGFRHINDFNEFYDLNQRIRIAGYFGNTDTIDLRFHYLIQSTPAERPWTLDLDITEVLNMSSPPVSEFYGIQMPTDSRQSISAPTVVDAGGLGVDFRMEISATETGVIHTIHIPQTSGATTSIDSLNKTVLIEGTPAQINTELAGLEIRFGEVELDFDLVFELTDVFEDSSADLVSDIKVTRFTSITTDLEISRQWIYNDTGLEPELEKPFRDGRFAINATSGVVMTISVPNNAFKYYTDIGNQVYSLDTTSVTLTGYTPAELETIVDNLRYVADQTYAGAIEWDFTITVDGTTYLDAYRYDMAGNYVVWDGVGSGVGASSTANISEGDEVNSTDYPAFVWGSNSSVSTLDIVAINNPAEANIVITWDLAYSDTIPGYGSTLDWELYWDSLPTGVSVTKTLNNKYRIEGIDSVSDWNAVKHPTRATMPNDASGNFTIKGTITYTPNRTKEMTLTFEVDEERELDATAWPHYSSSSNQGVLGYTVEALAYFRGTTGATVPTVQITDQGSNDPLYTMTVRADKPNSVDRIYAAGSLGGSALWSAGLKSMTLIGSKAQVNDHLANLTIDHNIQYYEDFYLKFALSNNVNSETDDCGVLYVGSGWDPVFKYDIESLSQPWYPPNGITKSDPITFDEEFTFYTWGGTGIGSLSGWTDGTVKTRLYNTSHLTSIKISNTVNWLDAAFYSFTTGTFRQSFSTLYGLSPKRHAPLWEYNTSGEYEYYTDYSNDRTYYYVSPYDDTGFWRFFDPLAGGAYNLSTCVIDSNDRYYHPTYFGPNVYVRTDTNTITGYGTDRQPGKDSDSGAVFYVNEGAGSRSNSDGNGWLIRHEPQHFGHCISSNTDASRIAIAHAGEVYTGGIYGDYYYYGAEYDGQPGVVGTNFVQLFGTEWGDFGALNQPDNFEQQTIAKSNYTTQYSNDYRATHGGCVYIYDNSTNYYTDLIGKDYAKPIQKIYPPISDASGDTLAAAGNHLLFGEYTAMSLDGNKLAISCPGWQSGNVDGVNLKGVYTYSWNSVTLQYDLDAVLGQTALMDMQWDSTGEILVGRDRDDITKLRIYSRNSNGSLTLLESLPITSTFDRPWHFSPVSRTIVISNTDGTIDIYEINNSTLDYSKTQEFSKGTTESTGDVQISTDGKMILWRILAFSNSTDSSNDFAGYGVVVLHRDNINDQFFGGINEEVSNITTVNAVEYDVITDFSDRFTGQFVNFPYQSGVDHRSYYGVIFPLGNRRTMSTLFAKPYAVEVGSDYAQITVGNKVYNPEYGIGQTEYFAPSDTTMTFNMDGSQDTWGDDTEFEITFTPDDSSGAVTRNYLYYYDNTETYPDDFAGRIQWYLNSIAEPNSPVHLNDEQGGTLADL